MWTSQSTPIQTERPTASLGHVLSGTAVPPGGCGPPQPRPHLRHACHHGVSGHVAPNAAHPGVPLGMSCPQAGGRCSSPGACVWKSLPRKGLGGSPPGPLGAPATGVIFQKSRDLMDVGGTRRGSDRLRCLAPVPGAWHGVIRMSCQVQEGLGEGRSRRVGCSLLLSHGKAHTACLGSLPPGSRGGGPPEPRGAAVPGLPALTPHPASALCTLCRRGHRKGGQGPLTPGGHSAYGRSRCCSGLLFYGSWVGSPAGGPPSMLQSASRRGCWWPFLSFLFFLGNNAPQC